MNKEDKEKDNIENNGNSSPAPASSSSGWGFSWGGFSSFSSNISSTINNLSNVNISDLGNQLVESVQQMNIVETIKKTSDQVVNIYKEDLQEFSKSLYEDTSSVIQNQYDNVKTNLETAGIIPHTPGGSSSNGSNNNNNSGSNSNNNSSSSTPFSPSSNETSALRSSTNLLMKGLSYLTSDPSNVEDYEQWSKSFGPLENYNSQINIILSGDESIKALYTKYVPNEISHQQFWLKYFYKQYKAQKEEERRKLILQQATKEEDIGWGDDEDIEIEETETEIETEPTTTTTTNTTTTTILDNNDEIPATETSILDNNVNNFGDGDDDYDSDEELNREIEQKYLEDEAERRKLKEEKQNNITQKVDNSANVETTEVEEEDIPTDDIQNEITDIIDNTESNDSTTAVVNTTTTNIVEESNIPPQHTHIDNNNTVVPLETTTTTPSKSTSNINLDEDDEVFDWE